MREYKEALARAGSMISQLMVELRKEKEKCRTYKNLLRAATKSCEEKNKALELMSLKLAKSNKIQYIGPRSVSPRAWEDRVRTSASGATNGTPQEPACAPDATTLQ